MRSGAPQSGGRETYRIHRLLPWRCDVPRAVIWQRAHPFHLNRFPPPALAHIEAAGCDDRDQAAGSAPGSPVRSPSDALLGQQGLDRPQPALVAGRGQVLPRRDALDSVAELVRRCRSRATGAPRSARRPAPPSQHGTAGRRHPAGPPRSRSARPRHEPCSPGTSQPAHASRHGARLAAGRFPVPLTGESPFSPIARRSADTGAIVCPRLGPGRAGSRTHDPPNKSASKDRSGRRAIRGKESAMYIGIGTVVLILIIVLIILLLRRF